ncbi:MoaD/ThiS family protein [Polaribacter sp.]|uniref:MoaD/ThiS family protein n=1 Tax=Polaribacter sp. TaxID=1920175 RepID=UPI0025E81E44|nr:MoaD/ThiS family protein [Polaribacter sp.]
MTLKVLFFGITRDLVGANETIMNLQKNTTVADFKKALKKSYPVLEKLNSYAIAVNEVYAQDLLELNSTDIIAIIPPVSGG